LATIFMASRSSAGTSESRSSGLHERERGEREDGLPADVEGAPRADLKPLDGSRDDMKDIRDWILAGEPMNWGIDPEDLFE
jgi:hypothetical protein